MNTLFVAWHDPASGRWYPVGRLVVEGGRYQFSYTQGALHAMNDTGFAPFPSFPDVSALYVSDRLFPLFSNRVLSPSRPDYPEFVQWVSPTLGADDPIALLARSGGLRETDTLELFRYPERDNSGNYHIHFFAHGLRHFPRSSIERVDTLKPGDDLLVLHDLQNAHDPRALMLRTSEQTKNDIHLLGFIPRYLVDDLIALLNRNPNGVQVKVERLNPSPAPLQFRLLCSITARWHAGFRPFSGPLYEAVPAELWSRGPMTNVVAE